jgi:hypothetical protein
MLMERFVRNWRRVLKLTIHAIKMTLTETEFALITDLIRQHATDDPLPTRISELP